MARKNLKQVKNEQKVDLDELIKIYAENKNELDSYKKLCDDENKLIRSTMMSDAKLVTEDNKWKKTVGDITATVSIKTSKSFNEVKLLEVMKELDLPGVVKTKEYVDMEALESAMYGTEISKKDLAKINACIEKKETTELRLTRVKKKEE